MTDISRREFLKIAFGTVSATALSGPLALAWPPEAHARPVAEAWRVGLSGGYLFDDEWTEDASDWPTHRDHWDYDCLAIDEKIECLLDHHGYDEQALFEDHLISKPRSGWHERALTRIEEAFGDVLDEPIAPDLMSPHERLWRGPYGVGTHLLEELPPDEVDRLGLWLVEGECPGSDFCGVRFEGDLADLNETLARHGINVHVGVTG